MKRLKIAAIAGVLGVTMLAASSDAAATQRTAALAK